MVKVGLPRTYTMTKEEFEEMCSPLVIDVQMAKEEFDERYPTNVDGPVQGEDRITGGFG